MSSTTAQEEKEQPQFIDPVRPEFDETPLEENASTSMLIDTVNSLKVQITYLNSQIESHQEELYLVYSELLNDLTILAWRTLERDYSPKRGEGWAAYLERLGADRNALRFRDLKTSDIEFLSRREKEIWHRDRREFVVSKRRSLALVKSSCMKVDRGHYMRLYRYIAQINPAFEAPLPLHFFKI
ncbi:hypothetical protein BB560_001142 [Smittium megazygosporum]|uniref:Uncharacterized protein n=1 Tax=Smittium megazygosporum TaxID=133381 RepID=A0A2T9ZIF1_9FUNG|nr:hypothetical protein BB560_001142 [Smittium megazygosporum]